MLFNYLRPSGRVYFLCVELYVHVYVPVGVDLDDSASFKLAPGWNGTYFPFVPLLDNCQVRNVIYNINW